MFQGSWSSMSKMGSRKLLGREAGISVEMLHIEKWTAEVAHNEK